MRQESRYSVPVGPIVAILVAFGVVMLVPGIPSSIRTVLAVGVLAITSLVAAGSMAFAGQRSPDSLKRARTLLAIGLAVASIGGVAAALLRPEPGSGSFPGVADAIFLVALPFVVAGLIYYPFAKSTVGSRLHALLDGAIAGTAIWVVLYMLILLPATPASGVLSTDELAIVAYPAAATFALGVVVSMVLRVHQHQRREMVVIACGLGILWLQEIVRVVLDAQGGANAQGWLAVVSEAGYLCLLAAGLIAWRQTAASDFAPEQATHEPEQPIESGTSWNRWLPLLPVVTVGGALLVGLVTAAQGESLTAVGFDSAALLILLLLAEQLLSNRELGSLNADLRKNSELFESLVTGSSDLITLHDDGGTLRYASPAVFRMLDLPPREVLGRSLVEFVHPDDLPKLKTAHRELMTRPGATAQLDLRVGPPVGPPTPDGPDRRGPWRWVEAVAHNMLADPNVAGVVVNTRDIHEQQILRQRLSYEAYHDPLTGLGNLALARRIFAEHCFGPGREPVTMILADLDGFKTINDTFGHAFGDDVLIAVARRIRRSVDDEDQIARIGGDEFVFILDAGHDAQAAAEQIIEAIRRPFLVQGNTVNVAASLGIARSVDAQDSVELLRNADLAMYSAKSAGGSTAVWYDAAMHEETAYRLRIQDGLRRALEESA
ncbi:MAG: sensor domain-containing diguanylate cyclase, partial [Candidatus Nanopelagicales bacterium]